MKELSVEEKAKRYDEAIKRGLDYIRHTPATEMVTRQDIFETIFPELKESEDEKIRKAIINEISLLEKESVIEQEKNVYQSWIAWLEKQGKNNMGISEATKQKLEEILNKALEKETPESCNEFLDEQKPADKVEPKFHEGDWVIGRATNNEPRQIAEIKGGGYKITYGGWIGFSFEEDMHLWTIQDAKDGDVLICKGNIKNSNGIKYERICLFNNLDNAFFTLTKTSNYVEEYDINVNIDYPDNTVPATKEQREILFMAIKEAGYEWDAEKKELRKIEQKPVIKMKTPEESLGISSEEYNKIVNDCIYGEQKPTDKVEPKFKVGDTIRLKDGDGLEWTVEEVLNNGYYTIVCADRDDFIQLDDNWELVEQKPAWNEEDEDYYDAIITKLEVTQKDALLTDNQMRFLKSLKGKVHPKQEWSEEDKTKIKSIIALLKSPALCTMDGNKGIIDESIKYLKSIKDRVLPQLRQEWSKEDKAKIILLESLCDSYEAEFIDSEYSSIRTEILKTRDWLESLKDRILPQSKQEWNEEDNPYYDDICEILINLLYSKTANVNKDAVQKDLDWFNSLKDRVQPQPKQEWSEKDEKMLQSCINIFQSMGLMKAYIKWLNSLKERVQPQNRWKPSDEQMEALRRAAYEPEKNWSEELQSLYCNLKKLREE